MFKTCFDVIFRSAYSQSALKKKKKKKSASSDKTHIAVTWCVCVYISVCVEYYFQHWKGYKYSGNNLPPLPSPPRLLTIGCSSHEFCILMAFFLMSALNFGGPLQDNRNICWHLNLDRCRLSEDMHFKVVQPKSNVLRSVSKARKPHASSPSWLHKVGCHSNTVSVWAGTNLLKVGTY